MSRPVKRSIKIAGHPTSISLETPFWEALRDIAASRKQSVGDLIEDVDRDRTGGLSSALRVFVLETLLDQLGGGKGN